MSQNQQEQSEAKLLAFIEGELDAAGRAEIEKHLEAHPQHRKLLEEMRGMRDWVRWLPKETAPAELAESFQMRLERTMLLDQIDEGAGRGPMRINRWPQLRAAAAVAVLALGLGAVVYYALPPRHNQFTTAPPATRPSNTVVALESTSRSEALKLADSMDLEKQAQTRERNGADKLADAPTDERKPSTTPATAPAEAETVLATGKSAEELRKRAAKGTDRESTALGEVGKKPPEPTEQLARIARDTYDLVSEDPRLINLLRSSNRGAASLALPVGGAATTDSAPAEKAALQADSTGLAQAGSIGSAQAGSARAGSLSSLHADLGKAAQAGRPFVMVVLAADTDRAHKQIGDYLAANGIETQSINEANRRRLLDETVKAKPEDKASPAGAHSVSTVGPAAPVAAPAQPEAPAPAVAAAPLAAPGAAVEGRPLAPAGPQQTAAGRLQFPAVPPAAAVSTPPPVPAAVPPAAGDMAVADGAVSNGGAPLGAPEANGNIFIARRMTARQARELQATLRQPAALQWAAVYRQPKDGSNPPQQLSDTQGQVPPAASFPAVSPSNPPPVRPSIPPAVSPSNSPVVSLSNPSSQPASKPGKDPSTQALARADSFQQKDRVAFKYGAAAGQTPAVPRSASESGEKDNANFAEKAPVQETRAHGAAMTRQAEGALAAAAAPPAPAPGAAPAPASAGGAGGGRGPLDRAMIRNKRDDPTTGPSGLPATRPNDSLLMERAAGASGDEQPVDVVIVLRQSTGMATTQPAGK